MRNFKIDPLKFILIQPLGLKIMESLYLTASESGLMINKSRIPRDESNEEIPLKSRLISLDI